MDALPGRALPVARPLSRGMLEHSEGDVARAEAGARPAVEGRTLACRELRLAELGREPPGR